jgi:hypothetical protein
MCLGDFEMHGGLVTAPTRAKKQLFHSVPFLEKWNTPPKSTSI